MAQITFETIDSAAANVSVDSEVYSGFFLTAEYLVLTIKHFCIPTVFLSAVTYNFR